jgi:hypothetical protein
VSVKKYLWVFVAALGLWPFAQRTPRAQGECLHGPVEDGTQRARRSAALRLVRAINTSEVNGSFRTTHTYRGLSELGVDLGSVPGFETNFTTDGETYSLILVDTTDPCGFAFSTNQVGVIFQGYPIDFDVQPLKR